jgi:uncharacterized lipoprotein
MQKHLTQALRSALALVALVSVVGCAQLSPQRVDFQPTISTESLVTGSGKASLLVEDRRSDKVIGMRGGAYQQTSVIESDKPLDKVIESLAVQVLEKAGIELSTTFPDYDIEISLDKLSYITEDQKASVKRTTVSAAVSIQVKKGSSTFENGYTSTKYEDTLGYPSEEKNSELLNSVFDAVLQRMFSDPDLDKFID